MMLSRPVLLGFIWSLLVISSSSGQPQTSSTDSNKVYAYSYHFQHNGTTNSKDILRSLLGNDPEFGLDQQDGKSIVKTFSSPGIRGFFTKGVLPTGPISRNFNNGINSPISAIRRVVENNLQPPPDITTGLLPPISPDISRDYQGGFNNMNHLGNVFPSQDDFPKIPPPPAPPAFPANVGNRNVENFSRDTPDGGKIVGRVETFSYNPPPISNSISRTEENSEGFRRNENILNNNREVTGHRTQTYFRQQYRTVTPNLESNNFNQNSRIDVRNSVSHNNNNQWWNGLNVLGNNNNNFNNNLHPPTPPNLNTHINQNINEIQNNINRAFGARLSGFRNSQPALINNNRQNNVRPIGVNYPNQNQNVNNPVLNQLNNAINTNRPLANVPFSRMHNEIIQPNIPNINNNAYNNIPNPGFARNNIPANVNAVPNHPTSPNAFNNNLNINNQYDNEAEKRVMDFIQGVRSHLDNVPINNQVNSIGPTWDDDLTGNINNDWSRRQSTLNRRPFSNGHSGPSSGPQSVDILKTTLDALDRNRHFDGPRNQGNYRNAQGGGVETFYGIDKTVEGPNSFSRNRQRGYERNFEVNSNSGYNRANQWSSNTIRRLDTQSSKPDFSTDFIDVFRDDK